VVVPALAGCSAVPIGVTAVGVDADGAPVAHVVVCEGQIDALLAFALEGENYREVGSFESAAAITDYAEISLTSPGDDWTVLRPLADQPDGVKYELSGHNTEDPNVFSEDVTFTPVDLAGLKPGEVMTQDWKEAPEGYTYPVPAVQSADEFREHACDDF
jgi:hypothetical protein